MNKFSKEESSAYLLMCDAARTVRHNQKIDDARERYLELLDQYPDNWEALFYSSLLKSTDGSLEEMLSKHNLILNTLIHVVKLIKKTVEAKTDILVAFETILREIEAYIFLQLRLITFCCQNEIEEKIKGAWTKNIWADIGIVHFFMQKNIKRKIKKRYSLYCRRVVTLFRVCGDEISEQFDMNDLDYKVFVLKFWMSFLQTHISYKEKYKTSILDKQTLLEYSTKIHRDYSDYKILGK